MGKDWVDLKNDWKKNLQQIERLGYTPVFIAHATQVTTKIPVSGVLQEQVNDTMTLVTDKRPKNNTINLKSMFRI